MIYQASTPGRTNHLRQIHKDFDPSSPFYGSRPLSRTDDFNQLYDLGTHRLPRSRSAIASTLWRFWPVNPSEELDREETLSDMIMRLRMHKETLEDVIADRGARVIRISELYNHHFSTSSQVEREQHLNTDPQYVEQAETIFYCEQKILVIRHLIALLTCQKSLSENWGGTHSETQLLRMLKQGQVKNFAVTIPETLDWVQKLKELGDEQYRLKQFHLAAGHYIVAIGRFAPWFPLSWYMSPWEARTSGLSSLLHACMINLGMASNKCGLYSNNYNLLDQIVHSDFASKWQAVKAAHHLITSFNQCLNRHKDENGHYFPFPIVQNFLRMTENMENFRRDYLHYPNDMPNKLPWWSQFSSQELIEEIKRRGSSRVRDTSLPRPQLRPAFDRHETEYHDAVTKAALAKLDKRLNKIDDLVDSPSSTTSERSSEDSFMFDEEEETSSTPEYINPPGEHTSRRVGKGRVFDISGQEITPNERRSLILENQRLEEESARGVSSMWKGPKMD